MNIMNKDLVIGVDLGGRCAISGIVDMMGTVLKQTVMRSEN